MKAILVLLCNVLAIGFTIVNAHGPHGRGPPPHVRECAEQANIELEDLRNMHAQETDEISKKFGCFKACMMQHKNMMNGASVNVEKMYEIIDNHVPNDEMKESARQAADNCASRVEELTDECEVAKELSKCFHENMAEYGIPFFHRKFGPPGPPEEAA